MGEARREPHGADPDPGGLLHRRVRAHLARVRRVPREPGRGAREPRAALLVRERPAGRPRYPSVRKPDHPVFGVSHEDLAAYCKWRSDRDTRWEYRLPTALEWEWAARGADGRSYPWGDSWDPENKPDDRAKVNVQGKKTEFSFDTLTEPAKSHPDARSIFDLYQMSDNLCEWTNTNRGGTTYELRGGSWGSPDADCRCWFSDANASALRSASIGGRVAAVARTR